jgi:hypothetical protein
MAVNNKFNSLNNALFQSLEDLCATDTEGNPMPVDVERIKAVTSVGNTLLKSAEVEMKYLELTGLNKEGIIKNQSTFLGSIGETVNPALNIPHGEA